MDQTLDRLGDWVRLDDRTWLCSTTRSSIELYEAVHGRFPDLDRILIVALDPTDRFGLAPDWIWEWIDGQRQDPPKTAAEIITRSAGKSEHSAASKVTEAAEG